MKVFAKWAATFLVLAVLAYGVDHGETKLGIPVFIWLALNLTVFLYLLARFVGRPMGAFLETRRGTIAADLDRATKRLEEAESLKQEVLARLSAVEDEVAEIHSRAETLGRDEAQRIADEAEAEAARFLRRIDDEISQRSLEERAALEREAASLTAEIARRILEEELTEEDRARLLTQSVAALADVERRTGR